MASSDIRLSLADRPRRHDILPCTHFGYPRSACVEVSRSRSTGRYERGGEKIGVDSEDV